MAQTAQTVINNNNTTRSGVGFCGLLFIVLLLLKVGVVETQVVQWSWWAIFAPLWVPSAIVFGILAIMAIFGIIAILGAALVSYFGNK